MGNFEVLQENGEIQNSPPPNVQNVEDDGNGFFITGINTHEQQEEEQKQEAMQPIDEEEDPHSYDPIDKYKHLAVVDCSKAFSNQEVSFLSFNSYLVRFDI